MRTVLAIFLVLAAAACARPRTESARPAPPPASIPETAIGLAPGTLLDVPEPPRVEPNESAPGERPVLPRAYPGAPPAIPHGIEYFLPLTAEANACVGCHGVDEKVEGGPTPMPESHYTDLRNAPGTRRESVVGARNDCTLCHVPQTGAKPLVGSRS